MEDPQLSFISDGTTGAWADRLTWRYNQLLLPNAAALVGRTIVDLGCHDGRWMHAALTLGARHVIGIDARSENLERCVRNLRAAGFDEDRYSVRQANVEDAMVLADLEYDVVLAFGILYHLLSPLCLLRRLCAAGPDLLLIDTAIARSHAPVLHLYEESPAIPGNAVSSVDDALALVCHPSEAALTLVLHNCGYDAQVHRWNSLSQADIERLPEPVIPSPSQPLIDYMSGSRILLVASPRAPRPLLD